MLAWENDTAHQLIEQHAETLMHRHSFPTHWQKVLDKNLEPQGPTRINYRGKTNGLFGWRGEGRGVE